MADFSRGEFDARLEAAEERTNARLAGIKADMDVGFARLEGEIRSIGVDVKLVIGTFQSVHKDVQATQTNINKLTDKVEKAEEGTRNTLSDIRSSQGNMILWYVGTTIVLLLGMVAILTFGKDMFDWGMAVSSDAPASAVSQSPGGRALQ